jgi:hypothetical protein
MVGLFSAVMLVVVEHRLSSASAQPRPDEDDFYGARIGEFPTYAHGIHGTVFAVDEDTLFVKDFSYDGNAPGIDRVLPSSFLSSLSQPFSEQRPERGFICMYSSFFCERRKYLPPRRVDIDQAHRGPDLAQLPRFLHIPLTTP